MPHINALHILIVTGLILLLLLWLELRRHRKSATPAAVSNTAAAPVLAVPQVGTPALTPDHLAAVVTSLNNHAQAIKQAMADVHQNLANQMADLNAKVDNATNAARQDTKALAAKVESMKAETHLHVSEMHVVATDRRAPEAKVPGPAQPPRPANDKAVG